MAANEKDTSKELLFYLLDAADRLETIQPDEIPNIDLYMDQVTTFMEEHLKSSCRHSDDKMLTKTMTNNYATNIRMPSAEKKNYIREHIMLLIFIYYYKGFLSLQDIQSILQPLGEKYFHAGHGKTVEDIYREITRMNDDRMENFREEVNDMEDAAADYFQDAEQSEKEFLRVFSMINMLAYDVYVRRMLIEKLVDRYFRDEDPGQVKNQRRKKKTGPAPDSER